MVHSLIQLWLFAFLLGHFRLSWTLPVTDCMYFHFNPCLLISGFLFFLINTDPVHHKAFQMPSIWLMWWCNDHLERGQPHYDLNTRVSPLFGFRTEQVSWKRCEMSSQTLKFSNFFCQVIEIIQASSKYQYLYKHPSFHPFSSTYLGPGCRGRENTPFPRCRLTGKSTVFLSCSSLSLPWLTDTESASLQMQPLSISLSPAPFSCHLWIRPQDT